MTTKPANKPVSQSSDQAVINQLKVLGLTDEYELPRRRLVCAVEGREFTGKTHFALGATPPIILIDVDLGTEGVIHKFQDRGVKILHYKTTVPKNASDKQVYSDLWIKTKGIVRRAYSLSQGTMVWDTESEINELARLAKFGKLAQVMPHHYAEVNRELRDMMDWAYDSSMSSIFIRKLKPKWVNNTRTNEYEGQGWNDMEYKCQVNLTMHRDDSENGPRFWAEVKKCRGNENVTVGTVLEGEMCNFGFLLSLVHDK